MPRTQPYLSPLALEDLTHYIAVNGENYEKYVAYAEMRGWKVFSRRYLHTWVGRHRIPVQTARHRHMIEVRQVSVLDRQARLNYLEANARKLAQRLSDIDYKMEGEADLAMKLMEQQRKLLEAIAKERGEWLHKDDGSAGMQDLHDQLMQAMTKALPDPDVVEGEVREVPSG